MTWRNADGEARGCEAASGGRAGRVRVRDSESCVSGVRVTAELTSTAAGSVAPACARAPVAEAVPTDARYHVPRSQVWEGSRGRQSGLVHLHVTAPFDFGRIHRSTGQALCGRTGWYERPAEGEPLCPRCDEIRARASLRKGGVLELVPVTLTEARRLVVLYHEHNDAPEGWKFGTGIACDGVLVGVAIVGRATGRGIDQKRDVEITRMCLDEKGRYKNAGSMLYGAACRMAAAGGYRDAYTYTLTEEDAACVRAAGFVLDADLPARETWSTPSRPRYDTNLFGERKRPAGPKCRWIRHLRTASDRAQAVAPTPPAAALLALGEQRPTANSEATAEAVARSAGDS